MTKKLLFFLIFIRQVKFQQPNKKLFIFDNSDIFH